jgi:cytochrome c-type biogenesis protein CcmH/NrfG
MKAAELDSDLPDIYLRLAEIGMAEKDWDLVFQNARRALAVNPLVPHPHRLLAQSAEAEGHDADAIGANRILLRLDPPDPADTHFRLARLLHKKSDPEAKRQVLQALEEAPRYRDALRLLRDLQGQAAPGNAVAPEPNQLK